MKSVLITGASRGIGRALCVEALKRGYRVHALVRNAEDALAGTQAHIADVREREKVALILKALAPEITHFIANAGIERSFNPRDPKSPQGIAEIFEVNGTAVAYSLAELACEWVRLGLRDRSLAVISSLVPRHGLPRSGAYSATKTAESIFAQGLSYDLARYGISVSIVRPGFVKTDINSKMRGHDLMMPVEKAARIVWNGLERRKFVIAFPLGTKILSIIADYVPLTLARLIFKIRQG